MRASHEWLRAFVPHTHTPEEVRRLISAHVATVDAVEPLRADLAPIVVARVVEAARHPDSDHLWVTRVDDGSGTALDVVCGAPNVVAGTLYPFARTGTVMPAGLRIEKRKIRGATSNGMLCSARELGLGEDHDGILALDVDVAPGTPFLDAVPVGDVAYEIDVLPNRPDLLCHLGLARELSAITGASLRMPPELAGVDRAPAPSMASAEGTTGGATVRIEDPAGCPRYFAAVIRGVTVGPSPAWLQERLAAVGVRPISNVVDATNYMLHAFGQPMHAFDLARLRGSTIVVRRARAGERLATLDGVERTLTPDMLVIADRDVATAIAGVIGGRESEVTGTTTDVLLEVANFDARSIRATRRALGLSTDASHRFERGTDPAQVTEAGRLAAGLIAMLTGGRVDGAPVLVGSPAPAHGEIRVSAGRLSRLLGVRVTPAEIVARMSNIGFAARAENDDAVSLTAPSWRADVTCDVDILEDIARLRGYDSLPDAVEPFRPGRVPDDPLHGATQRVRAALVAFGCAEVRPLPFVAGDDATHLRVTNPLADDEPHLRTTVLSTLARRAEYNLARREGDLRLFEIGSAFAPVPDGVREECRAAALIMGRRRPVHFSDPDPPAFDAWDAKALASTIARVVYPLAELSLEGGSDDVLWHVLADGRPVGTVSAPALDAPPWAAQAFGVEIVLGKLSLAPVAPPGTNAHADLARTSRARPAVRYAPIPGTPAAEFDLAFVVPDRVAAASIEAVLRRAGGDMLERVVLFDEFRGAGVPDGHRSLAWRLTFRHPERTLQDKEIAGRRQKIITTVEKETGVVARTV